MSHVTSLRSSSVFTWPSRSSSNAASAPTEKPQQQTAVGFPSESSFDAAPTRDGAKGETVGRTTQQALKQMNALLNPSTSFKDNGATVVANTPDMDPSEYSASARKQAAEQVKENASLEKQHLARMSKADREKYESVKKAVGKTSNPVAELALQKLLFEGKVPGGKDLMQQGTVLDHLASVAKGNTLHGSVDKGTLLSCLVQELATPSAIDQGGRGTCAPTSLAINLAITQPAEYARIMAGLASTDGKVKLADGKTTLKREAETAFKRDGTDRALTQRLLAPALMEVANGSRPYNDRTGAGQGATASELDILHDAIYGRDMKYLNVHSSSDRKQAMEVIDRELGTGQNVMAGLDWPGGGHKVLVTGTERIQGKDYIKYINPWGREERMLRSTFESRLRNINYDPRKSAKAGPAVKPDPVGPSAPSVKPTPAVPPDPVVPSYPIKPSGPTIPWSGFPTHIANLLRAFVTG